jgi:glutathione S-transferase
VLVQYIADQRPGKLAPKFGTIERWKLMEWLGFIATEVHKGFGPLWNPKTPPEYREIAVQALGNRFAYLSQTLGKQPYLTGNEFTIADAYLFVVSNWSHYHKVDLKPWPALTAFQARVAARPRYRRHSRRRDWFRNDDAVPVSRLAHAGDRAR